MQHLHDRMTFFDGMTQLRNLAAKNARLLNVPTARRIHLVQRGGRFEEGFITEVLPQPLTHVMNQTLLAVWQKIPSVQVQMDDYQVSGITSLISYETLISCTAVFIDAEIDEFGEIDGGIECSRVAVTPGLDGQTWNMVIRRKSRKGQNYG